MNGGLGERIGYVLLVAVSLTSVLTGCSLTREKLPVLTGVTSTPIQSHRTFAKPFSDDTQSKYLKGAVVRGPHYSLGIAWTAAGDEIRETAEQFDLAPGRAADGKQLLLASIDPKVTYAAFDPTPTSDVIVEVVVDGTATKLEGLPLPAQDQGRQAAETRLLRLSARPKSAVHLRVTDAGRTNSIDLRTGRTTIDAKGGFVLRQADVTWADEEPVVLVNRQGFRIPGPLEVSSTFKIGAPPASLTTYRPDRGWAAPGRAFLGVPAPTVSFGNGVSVFFGQLHAAFDDASVFSLQLPTGKPIAATPLRRDITLAVARFGAPQPGIVFLVPDDMSDAGVHFALAGTRLSEVVGAGRRPVAWAVAPKPFTLPLALR